MHQRPSKHTSPINQKCIKNPPRPPPTLQVSTTPLNSVSTTLSVLSECTPLHSLENFENLIFFLKKRKNYPPNRLRWPATKCLWPGRRNCFGEIFAKKHIKNKNRPKPLYSVSTTPLYSVSTTPLYSLGGAIFWKNSESSKCEVWRVFTKNFEMLILPQRVAIYSAACAPPVPLASPPPPPPACAARAPRTAHSGRRTAPTPGTHWVHPPYAHLFWLLGHTRHPIYNVLKNWHIFSLNRQRLIASARRRSPTQRLESCLPPKGELIKITEGSSIGPPMLLIAPPPYIFPGQVPAPCLRKQYFFFVKSRFFSQSCEAHCSDF